MAAAMLDDQGSPWLQQGWDQGQERGVQTGLVGRSKVHVIKWLQVQAAAEQLAGIPLNDLEPALRVGDKLGGHFVSGHIDGVGQLWDQAATGNAWELSFKVPEEIGRYIVPKGSVAVNGVSLTIAEVRQGGCWFKVAVIPQTYRETNLSQLQVGDPVNIEADILGKYVEKLLGLLPPESSVSLEFLAEHGYI